MSDSIALTSTSITAYNLSGSVATITFQYAVGGSGSYSDLTNPNIPTAISASTTGVAGNTSPGTCTITL